MGYIDKKPVEPNIPEKVHYCPLPVVDIYNRVGEGSKWQCDQCSTVWIYEPFSKDPIVALFGIFTLGLLQTTGWIKQSFYKGWYTSWGIFWGIVIIISIAGAVR